MGFHIGNCRKDKVHDRRRIRFSGSICTRDCHAINPISLSIFIVLSLSPSAPSTQVGYRYLNPLPPADRASAASFHLAAYCPVYCYDKAGVSGALSLFNPFCKQRFLVLSWVKKSNNTFDWEL